MANMIFMILLQLSIIISIEADSNICIQNDKSFTEYIDIIGASLEDFDFPVDLFDSVYNFLNDSGIAIKKELNSSALCEKGCSLHTTCVAFQYTTSDGCKLWLTEIQPREWAIVDLTEHIAVEEFRSYIIAIDECLSNPCSSPRVCQDMTNGYICECAGHLTGPDCNIGIIETELTFDDARVNCEILGGKLVEICDAELNEALKAIVEGYDTDIWIGARGTGDSHGYFWLTESCHFDEYNDWRPGEPYSNDNCVVLKKSHYETVAWHDRSCSLQFKSLCSFDANAPVYIMDN